MTWLGLLLVVIAGLGTGTIAWPIKVMRRFQFEQWWFIGMTVGLLVIPWAVTVLFIPNAFAAFQSVDPKLLIKSNIFAFGWGIANVLYALSVVRIGAALTGAILTALGIAVGVTVPMVFKGSGLFSEAPGVGSPAGQTVLIGVVIILIGATVVSIAGFGRERALTNSRVAGGYLGGLIMSVLGGILSCGFSLAFVYSQGPIVSAMKAQGAGDVPANFAVWAVGLMGGALVSILFPAYLMTKRKSWGVMKESWREVALAALIGVQFSFAVVLLGKGMLFLGALGASVGFGIQQATQILGNQGVGFFSGEWRDIYGTPRRQMYFAIIILLIGVTVMARGNMLAK
jgi:L-rhamnose-H+ transport protein